jgi:acetyl esterase/lipase
VAVTRYLTDPRQAKHPLASPLLADDLRGLPLAVIFTAEYDPLRADGERYAARLNAAGVLAPAIRHPVALHGSAMLTRTWPPLQHGSAGAVGTLRDAQWASSGVAAG